MTTGKKKRMSILDSLAASGAPAPAAAPMMASNRALRSARDAVDAHHVWELDPASIVDERVQDRIERGDVDDLLDSIEENGQTVPILVRRHPSEPERYLLVYGRRRLDAIRRSDKIDKVRALVASLDDTAATRAQISENMARRDLSFIEKALFAQELVSGGFGNQSQVAEVLTVTKSSVSMAIAVVDSIGVGLIRAIGPAHGIGRPRWEALGKAIEARAANRDRLIEVAEDIHTRVAVALATGQGNPDDASARAFEAVFKAVHKAPERKAASPARPRPLMIGGTRGGVVKRTPRAVTLTLDNGAFADWIEAEAQDLIDELHGRWIKRAED